MSSDLAISIRNVGKTYRRAGAAATTLAEGLMRRVKHPFRRGSVQAFDALDDVSFDIQRGDVVGIIGRNGAGKSTLLKILSRITEPTRGEIDLYGRVGSLLEVGTGFHPELTGRENIFLNGSILGMTRGEIRSQFDAIVDFAGVSDFLETPVKRYSSGMYVRLAFAVAAHLQPEILIVDEVLAVGDSEFQNKCLGKMQDVSRSGRTVLFVSHNMAAVRQLCKTGVLLRRGKLVRVGAADDVVHEYLSYLQQSAASAFADNPERMGNGAVRLTSARLLDDLGHSTETLIAGRSATLEFTYENPGGARAANMFMTLYNHMGLACTLLDMSLCQQSIEALASRGTIRCRIPNVPFPIGQYRVAAAIDVQSEHADLIPNALAFSVESSEFFPSAKTPPSQYCGVMIDHSWSHQPAADVSPSPVVSARTSCAS